MKHIHTHRNWLNQFYLIIILIVNSSFYMNAQTVSLNQIPTINCPSGNIYICGTYSPPTTGGPYTTNFLVEISSLSPPYLVTGGNEYLTTLTPTTFCFTIPVSVFGSSPFGNYEISVNADFNQVNAPFAEFDAYDSSTNDLGADIFYSNTCPIVANDDGLTISQCNSGTINVFSNDTFLTNTASSSNVILTQLTSLSPITFNTTTGVASIPAGTTPGTYNISYQICNPANASQCDTAIISFMVTPVPITAVNNTFSINTCSGGTTASVLLNDTLCGSSISTPVNVSFVGSVPISGATISNTGIISIPAGIPIGSYIFTYKVCHTAFPTICSNNATVTINVTAPPIVATNDNFTSTPISSLSGGFTSSVFTNDTVNGVLASSGNVITTLISSTPTIPLLNVTPDGLFISPTGIINIPVGVTIGTYTIVYSIAQVGCTSNIAYGSVTISVVSNIETSDIVPGVRANSIVKFVDYQTDNRIIISGHFTQYNGINRYGIARLNDNLTLDTTSGFISTGSLPAEPTGTFFVTYPPFDMQVIKNIENINKILIVGNFDGYSGSYIQGNGIARLLPNGAIDPNFNTGPIPPGAIRGCSGSNNEIRTLYVYPDTAINGNAGKIIIGGMFTAYNGVAREKIARLLPNGAIDPTFNPNGTIYQPEIGNETGFNSAVQSIAVQSDGKIIVGGYYNRVNGYVNKNIVRLNDDGSVDDTFNTYTGANKDLIGSYIRQIIIQSDDKIIIGGFFSFYNNVSRNSIARLYSNGTLDTTFNPGTGFFPVHVQGLVGQDTDRGSVRSMVYEPAVGSTPAKLFVSGDFTKYNNAFVQKVVLLNCATTGTTGSKDAFFKMNLTSFTTGGPNDNVWTMKKQGSKLLLGGKFTMYNSNSALRVTRILPLYSVGSTTNELKSTNIFYDSEPEIDLFNSEENDFIIYPNPSNGIFKIKGFGSNTELFSINIYNVLGQKVKHFDVFLDKELDIDLSDSLSGTYFISFSNGFENITKTFIIK